jgi:deoxyribonuclease IV
MWRASVLDQVQVRRLQATREQHSIHPLVVHVSYLINLASADPVIHEKSVTAFRGELERAEAIGAEYVVIHPGSFRDRSPDEGICCFVDGLYKASAGLECGRVKVLLENTAGAGSHLGSRFEELRDIRDLAGQVTSLPVGYCLDTCHLFAAGFDITKPAGLRKTLAQADEILRLDNIPLLHMNDSVAPFNSHVDRHARLGEGKMGAECFRRILANPKLRDKVFISETPVEGKDEGDRFNMDTLKSLAKARASKSLLR